jgi:hypothetical protein
MATTVVTSEITDVREIVRSLQKELKADPTLMTRFSSAPRTVLQEFGLASNMQRGLLQEDHLSTHRSDIRCFCGSYWSILTTITTGASLEDD